MRIVGIDENGLGPQLGPLIVTAVGLDIEGDYDAQACAQLGQSLALGDSKAFSAVGHMQQAEGFTLALCQKLWDTSPSTMDALCDQLIAEGSRSLKRSCPDALNQRQCWQAPMPLPAWGGTIQNGQTSLERLAAQGIHLRWAQSRVVCVKRLNDARSQGRTRLRVNLDQFEHLIEAAWQSLGNDSKIICGMVGGMRHYEKHLQRIPIAQGLEQKRQQCAYRSTQGGELSFEVDADAQHLPVGLASMVGKYLRELFMERQNRFYQHHDKELSKVSGYHDPKTQKFIEQSRVLRQQLQIDDHCFRRA